MNIRMDYRHARFVFGLLNKLQGMQKTHKQNPPEDQLLITPYRDGLAFVAGTQRCWVMTVVPVEGDLSGNPFFGTLFQMQEPIREILSARRKGNEVTIVESGNRLLIGVGSLVFEVERFCCYYGYRPEEFEDSTAIVAVGAQQMADLLLFNSLFLKDDVAFLHFYVEGDKLRLLSADHFHVATARIDGARGMMDTAMDIRHVKLIQSLMSDAIRLGGDTNSWLMDKKEHIIIRLENGLLSVATLKWDRGFNPDWKMFLSVPDQWIARVTLSEQDATQIRDCLSKTKTATRAWLLLNDQNLTLKTEHGVSQRKAQIAWGEVADRRMQVSIDPKRLKEVLEAFERKPIVMVFTTPFSPICFFSPEQEGRLRWLAPTIRR